MGKNDPNLKVGNYPVIATFTIIKTFSPLLFQHTPLSWY